MAIDTMTTGELILLLETERLKTRQLVVVLDELTVRANRGDDEANHYFDAAWHASIAEFN